MAAGWRSRGERELAAWAAGRGWRVGARNGMGHLVAEWPATGAKVSLPGDPRGRTAANTQAQLRCVEAAAPSAVGRLC